jgi:outer membrane protein TolC
VISSFEGAAQKVLTSEEALRLSLLRSPNLKATDLQIEQSNQLQKASVDLPNPDLTFESPTGEFMTIGVLQSFSFPTVYSTQHKRAVQQTKINEITRELTTKDVAQQVNAAYLNAQYFTQLAKVLATRDSLYEQIMQSSKRQFEAGEIDANLYTYSQIQRGSVSIAYNDALSELSAALSNLKIYTGIEEEITVSELKELNNLNPIFILNKDSLATGQSLFVQYAKMQEEYAAQGIALEKQKALPGFAVGYLNQAGRDTPFDLRLRAGISLPLWWWQYSNKIKAAKTALHIAEENTHSQEQQLALLASSHLQRYKQYKTTLNYYENSGLALYAQLIKNSQRMFGAGSIDYIRHLNNLNEAYTMQQSYYETIFKLNQTIIQLNYITAQ